MPAHPGILGRGQVAQRRVAVSAIVVALEVTDHYPGFAQGRPMVAVQALLPQPVVERFDVAVVPRLSGGMYDSSTFPSQNCCSAWETNSGQLSIRSTIGAP